jgi:hypothetical protein
MAHAATIRESGGDSTGASQAPVVRPFIPAEAQLPELTLLPILVGIVLGIVLSPSSLFLTGRELVLSSRRSS